ncbi:hypothetical protein EVJ58_g5220 [Rhodofomes roseus]|uniref:Uncharacterized protein n=1 Tax=Rhodofomes roseus TaxID=34475 RepID=A0A4Y9YFI5_9APHY|nr:hypothetical protein EVJ58_g5220 [Rhodofomes roseus]
MALLRAARPPRNLENIKRGRSLKRQAHHGPVTGIAVHNNTNDAAKASLVCSVLTKDAGAEERASAAEGLHQNSVHTTLRAALSPSLRTTALSVRRHPLRAASPPSPCVTALSARPASLPLRASSPLRSLYPLPYDIKPAPPPLCLPPVRLSPVFTLPANSDPDHQLHPSPLRVRARRADRRGRDHSADKNSASSPIAPALYTASSEPRPATTAPSKHEVAPTIRLAEFHRQQPKCYHRIMHSIFTVTIGHILHALSQPGEEDAFDRDQIPDE